MIFLRLQRRFRERALEWFCAAYMTGNGIILAMPLGLFDSPSYEPLKVFASNTVWAAALTLLGLAWLGGLFVNGMRPTVTAHIRVTCASTGFIVYLLVGVGTLVSPWLAPLSLSYFMFAFASIYSVYRATVDRVTDTHGQS